MNKRIVRLLGGIAVVAGLTVMSFVVPSTAAASPGKQDNVTICHATASESNPYVVETVDPDSILNGDGHGHSGVNAGDIIPPFPGYPGQNWDAAGQAIWNNGCELLVSTPTTAPPTTEPPTSEAPTSEPPTSQPPTSETPTTDVPTSEAPTSDTPTSEVPTSDTPTTSSVPSSTAGSSSASVNPATGTSRATTTTPSHAVQHAQRLANTGPRNTGKLIVLGVLLLVGGLLTLLLARKRTAPLHHR